MRQFFLAFYFFLAACVVLPPDKGVLISAHRGNIFGKKSYDNSIGGLKHAIQSGVPYLEVDIRSSKDGGLFLFHNKRIRGDVTSDSLYLSRPFADLTESEILSLRLRNGEKIPYFYDALKLVKGSKSYLQIDLKAKTERIVDQIISEVKKADVEKNILFQVESIKMLAYIRDTYPQIQILARCHSSHDLPRTLLFSPDVVQVDLNWLTPSIGKSLHKSGSQILVKTLESYDKPYYWRQAIEAGADILLTDRAIDLRDWISKAGNSLVR